MLSRNEMEGLKISLEQGPQFHNITLTWRKNLQLGARTPIS